MWSWAWQKADRITCIGAQAAFGGTKTMEERYPEAAIALQHLAEIHANKILAF
jgi:hypothetical protein